MAGIIRLEKTIDVVNPITKTLIEQWSTAAKDILARGVIGVSDINPTVALRYRYDYYGLLLFMGINPVYNYPYLLINGYESPADYDGKTYTVKILDNAFLDTYYRAFIR